ADLTRLGYAIVSGLARGIDAAAHEGALAAGGDTVAVLPGSIDRVTPPTHRDLAQRIAGSGALVAEWRTGMPATRGLFLRRNRLIAALARAIVVVEAATRSGALATAAVGFRLGRPLLAVPGGGVRGAARGRPALPARGGGVWGGAADVIDSLRTTAAVERDAARPAASHAAQNSGDAPGGDARCGALAPRVAAALDAEP